MTNANPAPIDTVLFDWGGTLATWRDIDLYAVWRSVATLIDEARADDLAARLVAAEQAAWLRSRNEHVSSTLEDICLLADVVMTPAALAEYERLWHPHTELDPDALELLKDLRAGGYRIGVLSNTIWSRSGTNRSSRATACWS